MGLLKKLYRWMGGVQGLLLLGYAWAIFAIDFYLEPERKLRYAVLFLGLLVVCPLTVRLLRRYQPPLRPVRETMSARTEARKSRLWFLAFFLFSLGLLLVWYFAYYPLSIINDTYDQYGQILAGVYSDWHPVLHTLLVLELPLRLTGSFAAVIPAQMLIFALTLAYMANTIRLYEATPPPQLLHCYSYYSIQTPVPLPHTPPRTSHLRLAPCS